ncbi:MAG: hypothetical protein JWS10_471 [Cypionkella sp.]|nr:hypothetical protein [Cypionkella sp.]
MLRHEVASLNRSAEFLNKSMRRQGRLEVIVTDRLRSYGTARMTTAVFSRAAESLKSNLASMSHSAIRPRHAGV